VQTVPIQKKQKIFKRGAKGERGERRRGSRSRGSSVFVVLASVNLFVFVLFVLF